VTGEGNIWKTVLTGQIASAMAAVHGDRREARRDRRRFTIGRRQRLRPVVVGVVAVMRRSRQRLG
jgi:hypothetical protein